MTSISRRPYKIGLIEHYVPEADKTCSCCGRSKARIGEDERRELEFIPACLEVQVHVLPKYACSHCHDGVKSPDGPEWPLPGCIAGAGLLSQLLISKFVDHLTLYRFEDISVRYGLHLPRATLCDWVRKAAELMGPLYDLQKQLVLQSPASRVISRLTHMPDMTGSISGRLRRSMRGLELKFGGINWRAIGIFPFRGVTQEWAGSHKATSRI